MHCGRRGWCSDTVCGVCNWLVGDKGVLRFLFEKHLTNQLQCTVVPSLTPRPSSPCLVVYACVLTVLVFNKSEINVFDAQPACGLKLTFL
uniref:Uncharacterized protein n=1 Tax=Gopherus agassizii TaxID=38772 RepID=A0A452H6R5_9SAUR